MWGENLVLCGDDERLGGGEPGRGTWMQCTHVGSTLVWQALLTVHGPLPPLRYRYVVVDDQARRPRRAPSESTC